MDRVNLRMTLPFALAVSTGGLFIWLLSQYFKRAHGRKRRPNSKFSFRERSIEELENADWELVGEVENLWIFPVKSCAGVPLKTALAERHGFKIGHIRDRSLMIIDKNGDMVTARKESAALHISCSFNEESNAITLKHPHLQPLQIDLSYVEVDGRGVLCRSWTESIAGIDCGDEAADWLSLVFNKPFRLAYHGRNGSSRTITQDQYPMIKNSDAGFFADLTGHMLMTTSSLEDLRNRVPSCQMAVENFRPGILVTGSKAYDEDNWTYIKIGDSYLRNVKPCERCIFPTINFKTAKRDPKCEPLKTLRKYRCPEGKESPHFGINLGVDRSGKISVSDKVYVLRD